MTEQESAPWYEEFPVQWYEKYPAPRNTDLASISPEAVLECLKRGNPVEQGYMLIDVRRIDHEGGSIRGSINIPAQSMHPSIGTLYTLFKSAGITKVIWYCGSCGSRGPRAAGWFADFLEDNGDSTMQSMILAGGVKGWARAGDDYVQFMDGYEKEIWEET